MRAFALSKSFKMACPSLMHVQPLPHLHWLRHHTSRPLRGTLCRAVPDYKIARRAIDELASAGTRFPWIDDFQLDKDLKVDAETVISTLAPLLTEDRMTRIDTVIAKRTFNVLPILEQPYDMGNVAAVCRSADAMGIGSLNIIRDVHNDKYKQSTRTSGGSEKWLDVQLFNDTAECINTAKKLGYRVVVTHLRADAVPINKVDWTQPTAIVFGNELDGASDTALALADEAVYIPIDGFVESYNMSVAAALIFWEVRQARMQALGSHGDLSPEEQHILKAVMFLRSKGVARQCITHLLKRPPPDWQLHRNNGQWFDKEFEEQGVDFSNKRRCDFWDGCQCYGERLLFPGKTCRYQDMHIKGLSTLNKGKLIHRCQSRGIVVPDLDLKRDRKTQPKAVVQEEREVEHVSV